MESQTKQREEMLGKFGQRTPVIPCGKGAFSEECISLLIFQDLRQSLLLFFPFVTYVDIFCTDDVGEETAFYIYF